MLVKQEKDWDSTLINCKLDSVLCIKNLNLFFGLCTLLVCFSRFFPMKNLLVHHLCADKWCLWRKNGVTKSRIQVLQLNYCSIDIHGLIKLIGKLVGLSTKCLICILLLQASMQQ